MDVCLTPEELRVLGCLLEQEVATLTQDLTALQQAFARFKQQFE